MALNVILLFTGADLGWRMSVICCVMASVDEYIIT